jgi:hypothetical protein
VGEARREAEREGQEQSQQALLLGLLHRLGLASSTPSSLRRERQAVPSPSFFPLPPSLPRLLNINDNDAPRRSVADDALSRHQLSRHCLLPVLRFAHPAPACSRPTTPARAALTTRGPARADHPR